MLKDRSQEAAKSIFEALQMKPNPEQSKQVREFVEQAMMAAYRDSAEQCTKVARACCAGDRDMAHKIADEIRRANTALVANLSSLR